MSESIIQQIKAGEGLTVEFKRTIDSPFKIARTIVSFANTAGGNLLIGVADDGAIRGIESELRELSKLEKATKDLITPEILLQIRTVRLDGKHILAVKVAEGEDKPYYAVNERREKIIYIRTKDKSLPIPKLFVTAEKPDDIARLLVNKHVKALISYLRDMDVVTARTFSRLVNISEQRADRLLQEMAVKQIIIKVSKKKPETFSLKWSE